MELTRDRERDGLESERTDTQTETDNVADGLVRSVTRLGTGDSLIRSCENASTEDVLWYGGR